MAKLRELVDFLELELKTKEIPDYSGAHNGLQFANGGTVERVICAVDASLATVEEAVRRGGDLLLVHHGLFWQGVRPVTEAIYRKFKVAMDGGLAIYSSHIPLDIHPKLGNNVQLLRALGFEKSEPFFNWKGIDLGRRVFFDGNVGDLRSQLESAVGGPVLLSGDEGEVAGTVGVITGGAGSEVESIAAEGIDTFISGEGPHWTFPLAEELGINVMYAGHYATETFGVKALCERLSDHFKVEGQFVEFPSGL